MDRGPCPAIAAQAAGATPGQGSLVPRDRISFEIESHRDRISFRSNLIEIRRIDHGSAHPRDRSHLTLPAACGCGALLAAGCRPTPSGLGDDESSVVARAGGGPGPPLRDPLFHVLPATVPRRVRGAADEFRAASGDRWRDGMVPQGPLEGAPHGRSGSAEGTKTNLFSSVRRFSVDIFLSVGGGAVETRAQNGPWGRTLVR